MASPMRAVAEVLSQLMHPNRAADIIRMADADPAFAAKLMEAVQADDFGRSLRMLVADAQWGAAPARPAPVRPEAPAALTTAQRMMRDPNIRPAIDANVDRLPPELAERIAADDPDAFMEAFQMIAEAEGELPPVRSIGEPLGDDPAMLRQAHAAMRDGYPVPFDSMAEDVMDPAVLREFSPAQQELMRELEANDWLGFDYPSQAANAVLSADAGNFEMSPGLLRARSALIGGQAPPPATRQMELPLTADVPTSFSAQSIGPIPTGPDFVATAGPLPGGMDALLQRLNAASGSRPAIQPAGPSVVQRGVANRLGDIAAAGIAGAAAGGGGFLMGRGIGEELFNQDAAPEPQAMGGDDLTEGDTAALAAETNPPPEVAATQDDDFSRIREMQGFVQEQNSDMEELKALKYKQDRTPEETQYLRMMKVPIPGDWRRVVDAGHVPLGEPTPEESAAADARIRNMVRMGATWDEARTRAYDDVAKKVIARTRQKAEAFLRANPDF